MVPRGEGEEGAGAWEGGAPTVKGEVFGASNGEPVTGGAAAKGEAAEVSENSDWGSSCGGVATGSEEPGKEKGEAAERGGTAGLSRKGLGGSELAGAWDGSRRGGRMVAPFWGEGPGREAAGAG